MITSGADVARPSVPVSIPIRFNDNLKSLLEIYINALLVSIPIRFNDNSRRVSPSSVSRCFNSNKVQ